MSWLTCYRRLDHRYGRQPRNHLAFPALAATLCRYKRLLRITTEDTLLIHLLQVHRFGHHDRPLCHFAALVAAESIAFEEALVLVARRARLMAEQSRRRPALMASISGVAPERVAQWCADCPAAVGTAVVGCLNGPRQTVVSGDEAAVRWVTARAAEASTADDPARVRKLTAGVASHSPLMDPVQEELAPALEALGPVAPAVPVLLNSTGRPSTDPGELRTDLLRQLSAPVRWNEAMRAVLDSGVGTVVDTGPGQVLSKAAGLHLDAVPVALNFMQPLDKVVPLP